MHPERGAGRREQQEEIAGAAQKEQANTIKEKQRSPKETEVVTKDDTPRASRKERTSHRVGMINFWAMGLSIVIYVFLAVKGLWPEGG